MPSKSLISDARLALITIASDSVSGVVLTTPITASGGLVQKVGSFRSTALSFYCTRTDECGPCGGNSSVVGCSAANSISPLVISFAPEMALNSGERLTVRLPGFTGSAGYVNSSLLWTSPPNVFHDSAGNVNSSLSASPSRTFSWRMDCGLDACATFTLVRNISAGTSVCIGIPVDAGITLPIAGVRANQTDLTIETNAVNGAVGPTAILWTEPVGAIMDATLDYYPQVAGGPTQISLSFVTMMCIPVNGSISSTVAS